MCEGYDIKEDRHERLVNSSIGCRLDTLYTDTEHSFMLYEYRM